MQEYAVDDINFLAILILQLKYKIIMPIDSPMLNFLAFAQIVMADWLYVCLFLFLAYD